MGADYVIAVDLGTDILGRHFRTVAEPEIPGSQPQWVLKLRERFGALASGTLAEEPPMPSMVDVLSTSMDIVQVRIARSRLAGEPPDLLVAPRLARLNLFDFHRAEEAIEEGHQAVARMAYSLAVLKNEST